MNNININPAIKILHLEDEQTDAELIARELKKGNIVAEIMLVDSKADFVKALKNFSFDIILSDHSLPSFNSNEALRMVKQYGISIPFILVTAAMSDEFAVQVMKEGAQDYLIKDRLQRLPSAVTNSIAKHRLEMEEQAARERLLFHIENTPLGFIEWNQSGAIQAWSKRTEEIFGWSEQEILQTNQTIFQLVYKDDLQLIKRNVEELTNGLMVRNTYEQRNVNKNKELIWCEWFNSVLKDKDGKVVTIMSLVQDISEKKKLVDQQEFDRNNLTALINNTGDLLWSVDTALNLITSNQLFDEMVKTVSGKTIASGSYIFSAGFSPEQIFQYKISYERALAGETFTEIEHITSPVELWSEISFHPIFKGKEVIGAACHSRNITARKHTELRLIKITGDLIQRNKALEQFAYIVSHNLRSPVANIIGSTSILNAAELSAETKELLRVGLGEAGRKLDNVIKDLNQILQVKSDINESKETVRFSELVEDITISIKNIIEKHTVQIRHDFSAIDELVTLKTYLYSIFYNLISNSIKYRQQQVAPVIEIKSKRINNTVELIFTDNGMGIDLQKKGDQVFGLYSRFHPEIEGKGMGLFMVKTQVETLGGKIEISSCVNKGTEFKIELDIWTE